jgi:hypothetical protein
MIRSFGDDLTEDLYHGNSTRRTRQVDPALVKPHKPSTIFDPHRGTD